MQAALPARNLLLGSVVTAAGLCTRSTCLRVLVCGMCSIRTARNTVPVRRPGKCSDSTAHGVSRAINLGARHVRLARRLIMVPRLAEASTRCSTSP